MKTTSERREQILSMLREHGSVQGVELAEKFNVSTVTIRNDLGFFEKQNIVTRTYGGAYLNQTTSVPVLETSLEHKSTLNQEVKEKIGRAAANLVEPGDTLILDSGTTTQYVARCLADMQDITVMSNGLNVVTALSKASGVDVLITGGTLRQKSLSFYGSQAEEALRNYHFDKLFLGVDGFELSRGITTHNENEARLNRCMCEVANEIIVVTDSSKFAKISLHKILELSKVQKVITDKLIPTNYLDGLEKLGIEVLLVD